MNKNVVIGIIVILLLIVGISYVVRNDGKNVLEDVTNGEMTGNATSTGTVATSTATTTQNVKEFTVIGENFKFSLNEMKVNQGDTVRITFKNNMGVHDFVIDEFDARTAQLQTGQEETIEFVADKKGTFEYYCSVGQHRQMGMKGNLIVE